MMALATTDKHRPPKVCGSLEDTQRVRVCVRVCVYVYVHVHMYVCVHTAGERTESREKHSGISGWKRRWIWHAGSEYSSCYTYITIAVTFVTAQSKKHSPIPLINCRTTASSKSTHPPPLILSKNTTTIIWDVAAKNKLLYFHSIKEQDTRNRRTIRVHQLEAVAAPACSMAGLAQASAAAVDTSVRGRFRQLKDVWLKRQVRPTQKIRENFFWEPEIEEKTLGSSSYNKCNLSSGYRALACSTALHDGAIVSCTMDAVTASV